MVFPDRRLSLVQRWAAGRHVDRAAALEATYSYARRQTFRTLCSTWAWAAVLCIVVGAIAGATGVRLLQYAVIGAVFGTGVQLVAFHNIVEAGWRPARLALARDTGLGDSLPRSRPSFAARSNVSMVAVAFSFALLGAMLAAVIKRSNEVPLLAVAIAAVVTLVLAVPISVGLGFSPSLQPIGISRKGPNGRRPVTTRNACRRYRTTTLARWQRHSTACRRVWLSGNDFKAHLALKSIPHSRLGCSNKATTCSLVSAAR
jgi:adenylate cyclase